MHEDIDPEEIEPEEWLIDWKHAKYGSPKILVMVGEISDEDDNLTGLSFKERGSSLRIHDLAVGAITDYDFFTHQQPAFNDEGTAPVVEIE